MKPVTPVTKESYYKEVKVSNKRDAVQEFVARRSSSPDLYLRSDGFYEPYEDDTCPRCINARWSSSSGAHLKTYTHVALKHSVSPRWLERAVTIYDLYLVANLSRDYGYRAMKVDRNTGELKSPTFTYGDPWSVDEINYARCSNCSDDDVPGEFCSCGFWGFWTLDEARNYCFWGKQSDDVVLKVNIGGNVVEGTEGFRAQALTILEVYYEEDDYKCNSELSFSVAQLYDLPTFDKASIEEDTVTKEALDAAENL